MMRDFEQKKSAVSLGGLFEFETPVCECFPEVAYNIERKYVYPLKITIKPKSKAHRYCFTTNEGLVDISVTRTDEDAEELAREFKKQRTSEIVSKIPVSVTLKNRLKYYDNRRRLRLGQVNSKDRLEIEKEQKTLLDIKPKPKQHTDQLSQYIQDFGYLLNPPKKVREIDIENLSAFYDRLYVMIMLVSELQKSKHEMDYNILFFCATYLANAKQASLTSYLKDNDENVLSCCHEFSKAWEDTSCLEPKYIRDGYDGVDEEDLAILEGRLILLNVVNPYEWPDGQYAKNIGFVIPPDVSPMGTRLCTHVYDSIIKKMVRLSFATENDYDSGNTLWPLKEDILFRDKICDLYAAYSGDADVRELIEFIMHIYARFPSIKEDENGAFIFPPEVDLNNHYSFTTSEINLLPNIAKKIIKKEMDYYLKNIHPVYDAEKMTASWEIPNLLTAMYFSLFYLNPSHLIYKMCERTDCGNLIAVTSTNSKLKFCGDRCKGIVTQRRLRKKNKGLVYEIDKNISQNEN